MAHRNSDVRLTGLDIPFWDMVWFMVKWTIATIPAFILLFIIAISCVLGFIVFMELPAPDFLYSTSA